jgi:hypothetical protein
LVAEALYRKIDCTIDVADPGYGIVLFALIEDRDIWLLPSTRRGSARRCIEQQPPVPY